MENRGRRWVKVAGGSPISWLHSVLLTAFYVHRGVGPYLLIFTICPLIPTTPHSYMDPVF